MYKNLISSFILKFWILPVYALKTEVLVVSNETKYTFMHDYCKVFSLGRAMVQAVSRRPPTADARVRSRVSPCGICGGQSGKGTGFPPSTSVFPWQFHSIGAPLLGKMKKKTDHLSLHLHHRVAQEVSRLRCFRNFCCGALLHQKEKV
jgi:hypothetical protein